MMKATDTFRKEPWRHNCAQAVANRWIQLYADKETVDKYAPYVGGHAPEGYCGALYAAMQARPERAVEISREFEEATGGVYCKDIKSKGHTPCEICVATADYLLEKYS